MRQTEPERLLADWKKLANQRDMQAEEYIKKLKNQLQSAQSKRESTMSSSSDGALFRHAKDGVDDDNAISWPAREKKLTQELAKLKQELAASSLALKSRAGQGMTNIGLGDEKAIRRLYEDLTGLVINKVEPAIHREKDYFRSFHAIFASDGYYSKSYLCKITDMKVLLFSHCCPSILFFLYRFGNEAGRIRVYLFYVRGSSDS